jgi:hypothetical protein
MAKPAVRQFAGDIRFWEKASNGALTPVIPEPTDPSGNQPVETNALTFGYEAGDEINVVSKRRDARFNQPLHSENLPGTTTVTVTLLEIPPLILARMLYGEGSTATVAAGAVAEGTPEVVTIGSMAVPVQLAHRFVSALVVKKGETTLELGTDYKADASSLRRGQFLPIVGGDIEEDDELDISYSYAAQVSTSIVGGATPTKSFYIDGDMEDRINEEDGELRIPQANLTVDGDVDWLSSEPLQVTMTGNVIVAAGESAPYTFKTYKATA